MRAIYGSVARWLLAHRPLALLSLAAIGVFWLGTRVSVPGVNTEALSLLTRPDPASSFGLYDLFTGGNLGRVTILALGIIPYVTALFIVYVVTALGLVRGWFAWPVRGFALVLSVVQSMAIAVYLERQTAMVGGLPLVAEPGWVFRGTLVLTLTAATAGLIWLSDEITRRGIGRGVSLVFFAGVVVGLPGAVSAIVDHMQAGRIGPYELTRFVVGLVVNAALVLLVDPARWVRMLNTGGPNKGEMMHGRVVALSFVLAVVLAGAAVQAQQLEIRAAAVDSTDGWVRMELPDGAGPIWVAPTSSLTGADIARVEPRQGDDGQVAVSMELTAAGAAKMRQLSAAQLGKPLAMVLDGSVISAPTVRSEIGGEVMITGRDGLTPDEVERIIAAVGAR